MFFVDTLAPISPVSGTYYGLSWINGNGIAIAKNTFSQNSPRFDTLAHEIGHVLNLDHGTLNANNACTGRNYPYQTQNGCNAMAAGSNSGQLFRIVPLSSGCLASSSSYSGGSLYDIDTGLCPTAPKAPQADQILLGTGTKTATQQSTALASNFLNPQQSVISAATAGSGTAAATMSTTTTTTTSTTAPSSSGAINFTIGPFAPVQPNANGSNNNPNNQFIVALILAIPDGFNFYKPSLTFDPKNTFQPYSSEYLNGNRGTNNNCLKPLAGTQPSVQCLEIDFLVTKTSPGIFQGSFNTGTTFSFSVVITNQNTGGVATLSDLQCVTPVPLQCLNLTYVFGDLHATTSFFAPSTSTSLTANSNAPDVTVPSVLVNPADFPSIASLSPPYPPFMGSGNLLPLSNSPTNQKAACTDLGSGTCPPGKAPGCSSSKQGSVGACD